MDYINKHNFETEKGKHTFTLAINEYSDLSTDEWRKYLLGMDVQVDAQALGDDDEPDKDLPDSVDWRSNVRYKATVFLKINLDLYPVL